jgi:hypothetical protein
MTDEDKKLERAKVHVALKDAENALMSSRRKMTHLADGLEHIARKIRHNARLEPSGGDFSLDADLSNRLSPQDQALLDFGAAAALIEELKQCRQNLYRLQNTKDIPARH